jgi:DNA-binding NarL/FixJ family response regulator
MTDSPNEPSDEAPVTLMIVDDHAMVAESLRDALGSDENITVVGTAASVAEAAVVAAETQPQVALVDFRLPDGTGAVATREIRAASPDTAVVIITAFGGPELLAQAIEAGCSGFLKKNEPLSELVAAVRAAGAGEVLFTPDLLAGLVERLRNPGPVPGADLTQREHEVLQLLARGYSADKVAEKLVVSRHTARNHIQNVIMKLGAHSKLEAVAIALREKIITLDDTDTPST